MSHARTNQNTGAPSLLGSDRGLIWTYTANAVTVSKRPAFANLSAWIIASHSKPCTDKSKHGRAELARKRQGFDLDVYGECRDSEQTPCVCEPVGMDHCVPPEATLFRKTAIYQPNSTVSPAGFSMDWQTTQLFI
jgi:hypothetical protein